MRRRGGGVENGKFAAWRRRKDGKFRTAIIKGLPHGQHATRGTVTGVPLIHGQDSSLWLEHVESSDGGSGEWYWLMWYTPDGWPTIPASSIFEKADFEEMTRQLIRSVP